MVKSVKEREVISMHKIVNPCMCDVGKMYKYNAFAKIEYSEGKLSITGVIGPRSNGDCFGSCGQCVDDIRKGAPIPEWTDDMLQKFCDIWDEWHLNDMRAYCSHMKKLGWLEQMKESVEIKKWDLKREAWERKREAEKRAVDCLKAGETFVPTPEEVKLANLDLSVTTYNGEDLPDLDLYEFKQKDCIGHSNLKYERRSWLSIKNTHLGFIGKPCPVCGYKYGSSWLKEEVPEDVIAFLESLPESKITPAWI